jgi:hypothetical protein
MCIEERVFADLPWRGVVASFETACALHGDRDRLIDQVQSPYGAGFERDPAAWADGLQLRTALGKAAKAGKWFKRQDRAQEWARAICGCFDDGAMRDRDLVTKLNAVRTWIDRA